MWQCLKALLFYSKYVKFIYKYHHYIHCSIYLYAPTPSLKKCNFCYEQIYLSLAGKGLIQLNDLCWFQCQICKILILYVRNCRWTCKYVEIVKYSWCFVCWHKLFTLCPSKSLRNGQLNISIIGHGSSAFAMHKQTLFYYFHIFTCQIYCNAIYSHLYFEFLAINWHKSVKIHSPEYLFSF